jgi:N-succinyldiaminopimelate aminotransferase
MRDRTLVISSGGKTFNTTGWKIGWICAPPPLLAAARTAKQFLTYVSGAPFQPAIAVGLDLPDPYFADVAASLARRCGLLSAGLQSAGFSVSAPAGGYFIVADAAPLGYDDAVSFCRALPDLAGVVAIPLTAFVQPERVGAYRSLVRFAFCKRDEVLDDAVSRLTRLRSASGR